MTSSPAGASGLCCVLRFGSNYSIPACIVSPSLTMKNILNVGPLGKTHNFFAQTCKWIFDNILFCSFGADLKTVAGYSGKRRRLGDLFHRLSRRCVSLCTTARSQRATFTPSDCEIAALRLRSCLPSFQQISAIKEPK